MCIYINTEYWSKHSFNMLVLIVYYDILLLKNVWLFVLCRNLLIYHFIIWMLDVAQIICCDGTVWFWSLPFLFYLYVGCSCFYTVMAIPRVLSIYGSLQIELPQNTGVIKEFMLLPRPWAPNILAGIEQITLFFSLYCLKQKRCLGTQHF